MINDQKGECKVPLECSWGSDLALGADTLQRTHSRKRRSWVGGHRHVKVLKQEEPGQGNWRKVWLRLGRQVKELEVLDCMGP